jgi:SM-20-related protein
MSLLIEEELAGLADPGFVCKDGILGEKSGSVRIDAIRLADQGMRQAGLAGGVHPELRSDELRWLDVGDLPILDSLFATLRGQLNRELFLSLGEPEVQLARYTPGARYVRHRDAVAGKRDARRVTAIFYLNPWRPGDGGELVIHPSGAKIEPVLDRLVVFRSELEHEVLETAAVRLAVTAWYR